MAEAELSFTPHQDTLFMSNVSSRRLAHSRLASCALVASFLVGCGGGGSDNADAASATPALAQATTAYAKTSNTVLLAGKTYGLSRSGADALLQQCNGYRAQYGLPPMLPSEAVLASLDVSTVEKYYTSDKALTASTSQLPTVPGTKRWVDDYAISALKGQLPATPPDCTLVLTEQRHATLWRDGKVYDLRFSEKKAVGILVSPVPVSDQLATLYAKASAVQVVGQTCRDIVNPTGLLPGSHSCIWDLFPYVNNLNWPFVLSGQGQFGPVPGQIETIVPLEARAGQPIDSSVFAIPSDFTVVPL